MRPVTEQHHPLPGLAGGPCPPKAPAIITIGAAGIMAAPPGPAAGTCLPRSGPPGAAGGILGPVNVARHPAGQELSVTGG